MWQINRWLRLSSRLPSFASPFQTLSIHLYQMDTKAKSKGFGKCSIWCASNDIWITDWSFSIPDLQLFLDALVFLGLGEAILLHAVVVNALDLQVGAVRAVVLLAVAVVVNVVVHGWRWRWRGCHHHTVQLLLRLHEILLNFLGLERRRGLNNTLSCGTESDFIFLHD